jgi:hypothetical protein
MRVSETATSDGALRYTLAGFPSQPLLKLRGVIGGLACFKELTEELHQEWCGRLNLTRGRRATHDGTWNLGPPHGETEVI